MLDYIRTNAGSWMVKVLFGLIITVFIFWGVGSLQPDRSDVVVTVNEVPVLSRDFQAAYQQTVENLRARNQGITEEDIRSLNLKQTVLEQLVQNVLFDQLAHSLGVSITDEELRQEIRHLPVFLNEQGLFDRDRYQKMLAAQRMTPAEFESEFKASLLREKLRAVSVPPVVIPQEEARRVFDFLRQKAVMEYMLFNIDEFTPSASPTDEELRVYYDAHPGEFTLPTQIALDVVRFDPAAMAELSAVSEQEVEAYYAANPSRFARPEQVKARHILLRLEQNATDAQVRSATDELEKLRRQIQEGAPFAEAAEKHSQDTGTAGNGGELGWFARGQMVPEFENAAFALEPGMVSEPVRTIFGVHLILVEDTRPAGRIPLEEAAPEIRRQLAENRAVEEMQTRIDDVLERLLTGESLEQAGRAAGLKVDHIPLVSQARFPQDLGLDAVSVAYLFSRSAGEATDTPLPTTQGFLLAQITEKQPSAVQPFEDVRESISEYVLREKGREEARRAAEKALAQLTEQKNVDRTIRRTESFGRNTAIPGLGENVELSEALFGGAEGKWLPNVYASPDGAVIARPVEFISPDQSEWERDRDFWINSLQANREQAYFEGVLRDLRQKADVQIVSKEMLVD